MEVIDAYRLIREGYEEGREVSLSCLVDYYIENNTRYNYFSVLAAERYVKIDTHMLMRQGLIKVQWTVDNIIYKPIIKNEQKNGRNQKGVD